MMHIIKHELKLQKMTSLKLGMGALTVNLITIMMLFLGKVNIGRFIPIIVNGSQDKPNELILNFGMLIGAFLIASIVITMSMLLLPLVSSGRGFLRDIFGKNRYLLLSLPETSERIIGSKILVAIFDFATSLSFAAVIAGSYTLLLLNGPYAKWIGVLGEFLTSNLLILLLYFLKISFEFGTAILMVYLVILIAKIVNASKPVFGIVIAIIIFNVGSSVWGLMTEQITKLSPRMSIPVDMGALTGLPNIYVGAVHNELSVNIFAVLCQVLLFILLFKGNAYLIDKKVEA